MVRPSQFHSNIHSNIASFIQFAAALPAMLPDLYSDGVVGATLDGGVIGHNGNQVAMDESNTRDDATSWHVIIA